MQKGATPPAFASQIQGPSFRAPLMSPGVIVDPWFRKRPWPETSSLLGLAGWKALGKITLRPLLNLYALGQCQKIPGFTRASFKEETRNLYREINRLIAGEGRSNNGHTHDPPLPAARRPLPKIVFSFFLCATRARTACCRPFLFLATPSYQNTCPRNEDKETTALTRSGARGEHRVRVLKRRVGRSLQASTERGGAKEMARKRMRARVRARGCLMGKTAGRVLLQPGSNHTALRSVCSEKAMTDIKREVKARVQGGWSRIEWKLVEFEAGTPETLQGRIVQVSPTDTSVGPGEGGVASCVW